MAIRAGLFAGLRERVLSAVDGGMAVREAAVLFRVSISYIYKATIRRRLTGETIARPQRCHVSQKLTAYYDAIRARVFARSQSDRTGLCKAQGAAAKGRRTHSRGDAVVTSPVFRG